MIDQNMIHQKIYIYIYLESRIYPFFWSGPKKKVMYLSCKLRTFFGFDQYKGIFETPIRILNMPMSWFNTDSNRSLFLGSSFGCGNRGGCCLLDSPLGEFCWRLEVPNLEVRGFEIKASCLWKIDSAGDSISSGTSTSQTSNPPGTYSSSFWLILVRLESFGIFFRLFCADGVFLEV